MYRIISLFFQVVNTELPQNKKFGQKYNTPCLTERNKWSLDMQARKKARLPFLTSMLKCLGITAIIWLTCWQIGETRYAFRRLFVKYVAQ